MKKKKIKITHQEEKTVHHFLIENPDRLKPTEVERIKLNMGVDSLFINGKYYR